MPRTEFTALLFFALISLSPESGLSDEGKISIQRSPSVCGGPSQWDCSGRRLDGDGDVARVTTHDLGPDNIQMKPRIIDGNGGLVGGARIDIPWGFTLCQPRHWPRRLAEEALEAARQRLTVGVTSMLRILMLDESDLHYPAQNGDQQRSDSDHSTLNQKPLPPRRVLIKPHRPFYGPPTIAVDVHKFFASSPPENRPKAATLEGWFHFRILFVGH
ncbi:hypothetical protein B0H13DRAFT_1909910 [Mycena leptocephala]|nr:hypothetical protein B0H13DRAFT_1909910 [Mycena leptocephala]